MPLEDALACNLIPVTAIALGILWFITGTVMTQWRRMRLAEQDAVLKRMMLEKGYPADDIVRVLTTSTKRHAAGRPEDVVGDRPPPP